VAVTQALGAGRRDQADAVARAVVGASTWLGLGGAVAALIAAGPLLALVNAPPEVAPLAQMLLQALAPALMLDAWNANMSSVMRSHLRSREALAVVVVIQVITLVVALLAMPRLGLVGYALACALGRGVGLALHITLWRTRLNLRLRAPDWWRLVRAPLATVLHIGIPGAAENISWRLAFMTSLAAVAQLGANALATHAYTTQFLHVILMFSLAISFAVEIMVGHMIGAGRLHAANRLVRRSLALGIVLALVVSSAFALAGPWLLTRFTSDPAIVALGCTLLWWTVLVEPGRSFNLVVINALRATGDARYPVVVGSASMAIVLAGGSWFLGVYLGWGLVGVWIAYAADEWIRGLLMWRRWATLGWLPHARAAHRRLRHSRAH
jgi:Na+-driven multidrug efflux pump